ncbi:MAG: radical SAM protein [Pedobacter sp.]|uniref:B12-binding domain-containing radical SAM protein n=1 Tax=Pedobacter sp. TaxID=1411316 RepID=UPI00356A162E
MNIGIICPKYVNKGQTYVFNLALATTSAWIKQHGYNVVCLNPNHYDEDIVVQVTRFVKENGIDIVYVEDTFVWHRQIREIFDTVKKIDSRIVTIAGGTIVTRKPDIGFWGIKTIDLGIIGEVEETIIELLEMIEGKNTNPVNGTSCYDPSTNKYILMEPRRALPNLDTLPIPDYEGFKYGKYMELFYPSENHFYSVLDEVRVGNIMGSRSCPFKCNFCYLHGTAIGNRYRQRSMDHIFREIDYLVEKYNINFLNTYDLLFSVGKDRLYEFAKRIKKYNIKWWAQIRVPDVDEDLLKTLKDAGMFQASYGIESIDENILHSMGKHITVEQIEHALELTYRTKINIQGNIIIGDMEDTKESVEKSLEWLKKNWKYGLNLVMIRTHPFSPQYMYAVEKGIITDQFEHLNNVFPLVNCSKMSNKDYESVSVYSENYSDDPRYFYHGEVMESCVDHGYTLKIKCQNCGTINEYRHMHRKSFKTFFKVICRDCHVHLRVENLKAYGIEYSILDRVMSIVIRELKTRVNSNRVLHQMYCMVKKMKNNGIIKVSEKYV